MSNRAFVCFCVDGPSDIDALKVPFEDLFDQIGHDDIDVRFRFADFQNKNHGDITSKSGVTPENIEKNIYKYYFKNVDKRTELGWDDVTTIIHIIDLDGAYVPRDNIRLFTEEEEAMADSLITAGEPKNTLYLDDHIAVRSNLSLRQDILLQKRKNIEYLLNLDEITVGKRKVRYMLFYFSCNLDHFLHGNANMVGAEKMRNAADFSRIVTDANSLVTYFSENEFCTENDYAQSWKCLRRDAASLQRGSNVHLLIQRILNSSIEDWS